MSPHDHLCSEARRMRKILEEYIAEFDPPGGEKAWGEITKFIMTVDLFTEGER